MSQFNQQQVTVLLREIQQGGPETIAALFPLIYEELHRLAHAQLRRERADHTLNTGALVHEAYLKLIDQKQITWRDKAHFFAIAARGMRQILVDYARKHKAEKRGGGQPGITLEEYHLIQADNTGTLLALDYALEQLHTHHPRMAQIVECRFFGGMTVDETAAALDASRRTVEREWTRAKAYLSVLLTDQVPSR